jgi:uncharacterized spore protein YtfJ
MSARGRFERVVERVRLDTASGPVEVRVGSLRTSAGASGRPGSVLGAVGLGLPLSVEAGGAQRPVKWSGRGFGFARVLFAGAREGKAGIEGEGSPVVERVPEQWQKSAAYPAEQVGRALHAAASGAGAVGPVTAAGAYTVIPLTETLFSGGFGAGAGGGTSAIADDLESIGGGGGGGGGGTARSRTIAVAVIGPDGVEVRPVVDRTGLAIAALAALGTMTTRLLFRRRRRR